MRPVVPGLRRRELETSGVPFARSDEHVSRRSEEEFLFVSELAPRVCVLEDVRLR